MLSVAYLACQGTLPGSSQRRTDAFEHDLMMAALVPAFAGQSLLLEDIAWDDMTDWSLYDAVIIGTTWDYWDRHADFLDRLDHIGSQTLLMNAPELARWNSDKSYLKDLQQAGIAIVPTLWADDFDDASLKKAQVHFGTQTIVAKRAVGANAEGQFILTGDDPIPPTTATDAQAMMLQPFLPAVQTEGEYSFIFVGQTFSHALIKRPQKGDYRVQSDYGGSEHAITPSDTDLKAAQQVISALSQVDLTQTNAHETKRQDIQAGDASPLYARIDMVRGDDGSLLLMECELIEPFLYPTQGPGFAALLAAECRRRIAQMP